MVGVSPLFSSRFLGVAQFRDEAFIRLQDGDLTELMDVANRLERHDQAVFQLKDFVSDFRELVSIPHDSRLRFMGYFAILESLVAHKPNPDDPYQSLTRQVTKKMQLLERRFAHQLSYADFQGASSETVWKALYDVRSTIAHGGRPEFSKKTKLLRDLPTVTRFITEATWRVLRQVLDEPRLVADLRDC